MSLNATHTTPHAQSSALRTVDLSQAGAFETLAAYERNGVAIEAQVHSADDVEALVASRYVPQVARVVVAPAHRSREWDLVEARQITRALRAGHVDVPRILASAESGSELESELALAA